MTVVFEMDTETVPTPVVPLPSATQAPNVTVIIIPIIITVQALPTTPTAAANTAPTVTTGSGPTVGAMTRLPQITAPDAVTTVTTTAPAYTIGSMSIMSDSVNISRLSCHGGTGPQLICPLGHVCRVKDVPLRTDRKEGGGG